MEKKKLVIFICHGNICRSPIAEYIAKHLDKEGKYRYLSRAVSNEERGNDIYPPMKRVLIQYKIPYDRHAAQKISLEEFKEAEYIFTMDKSNMNYLRMLFPYENFSKVRMLEDFEIEDPWYTGNYEWVFRLIYEAIEKFLEKE